jgi:hypothetical protein
MEKSSLSPFLVAIVSDIPKSLRCVHQIVETSLDFKESQPQSDPWSLIFINLPLLLKMAKN